VSGVKRAKSRRIGLHKRVLAAADFEANEKEPGVQFWTVITMECGHTAYRGNLVGTRPIWALCERCPADPGRAD